jgi:hypothetical protein
MAYRIADRILAGCGVTKAAGGAYAAQREAHADAWMPLADALVGADGGLTRIREQMDGNLQKLRLLYEQDQAMKSAAAQAFDAHLGREPRGAVPYDPERFGLRTELVPRGEPPHVNGHGAAAPERGHL